MSIFILYKLAPLHVFVPRKFREANVKGVNALDNCTVVKHFVV